MKKKSILSGVMILFAAMAFPLHAALPPTRPTPKPNQKPTPRTTPTPTPSATPTPAPTPVVIPKNVETFTVTTPSASNPEVMFYVRIPASYSRTTPNRVLLRFPGDNVSGLSSVTDSAFSAMADERGWFIVSATFKQETGVAPADSYYDPAGFSGKAVWDALDVVSQKYPIAKEKLLLHGNEGGGQFVQRFALMHPDKVLAVAVNAANGFAKPNEKAAQIQWLVTNITSDANADNSLKFVDQLRQVGVKPIVRSYGEMARIVVGQVNSGEMETLSRNFFKFHDDALRAKCGLPPVISTPAPIFTPALATGTFVGDLRNLRYYKEDAPEAGSIPEASKVVLPCEALARVWSAQFEKFIVKTSSPLNPEVPFYVRIPANYSPTTRARVLFRCPIYNGIGIRCASGDGAFQQLADERGWFIIAPTFKQEKEDTKERAKSYYYPELFSGKATLEALDLIAKKYPIATDGLLMQGMSGGAQFVHRFAIWAPERVAAVAVNSSSWFDAPNERSAQVAWLITIGESDKTYENSLNFFDQLRKVNALPIFRSYVGMIHEGCQKVDDFNLLFLKSYDDATQAKFKSQKAALLPTPPIPAKAMPFVGDMKDWTFSKNEMRAIMRLGEDNLVYLPSMEIAQFWTGKGAEEDGGKPTGLNGAPY